MQIISVLQGIYLARQRLPSTVVSNLIVQNGVDNGHLGLDEVDEAGHLGPYGADQAR